MAHTLTCARFVAVVAAFALLALPHGARAGERGVNRSPNRISLGETAVAKTAGLLFVADETNNVVNLYNPISLDPLGTISNGITTPDSVAVDSSNDLYVTNRGNHSVTEYAPPYSGPPIRTLTDGMLDPTFIGVTRAGVIYVSDYFYHKLLAYKPGATSPTAIPFHALLPSGIAEGSDGGLYVGYNPTNFGPAGYLEFPPGGTGSFGVTLPISVSFSGGITFDAAGNLVVVDQGLAVEVWPPHSQKPSQYIFNNFRDPFSLAFNAHDSTLYVSDSYFSTVQRISYPQGRTLGTIKIAGRALGVAYTPPTDLRATSRTR